MSSFNRRTLLLLPLALAACGFTPAYGPNGAAKDLPGTIRVADPADKNAFELVQRLEERLGPAETTRYDLTYSISASAAGVGITPDNAITRYTLNGAVVWDLKDHASGARLTGGTVKNFTAWSATGSTVAGITAEEEAYVRLMRLLADQIVTQLVATSAVWAK
jgi:LPS-assembly lipoprotein